MHDSKKTKAELLDELNGFREKLKAMDTSARVDAGERAPGLGEAGYRGLFEDSPIALLVEDFSKVSALLDGLGDGGVDDVAAHVAAHPEFLARCIEAIEVLDVNRASVELFEASGVEELKAKLHDLFDPESHGLFRKGLAAAARGVTVFQGEAVIRTVSGVRKDVVLKWSAAPGRERDLSRVCLSMIDISELKKAERALKASEENYRAVFDNASDAIFIHDIETMGIMDVNRRMHEMYGYEAHETSSLAIWDLVSLDPPFSREEAMSRFEKVVRGAPQLFEWLARHKSGRLFWIEVNLSRATIGGKDRVLAVVRDISDRKRAEEALEDERERLAVTLRSIGDGVITTDTHGRVALMNRVAENLTGWRQAEAAGRPISEVFRIVNEKTRAECVNPVERVLETAGSFEIQNGAVLISREGTERAVADTGSPIKDKDGGIVGVVLVFRDVTEKRKIEAELARAEKLESLGILAGGIAHDFNNILTGILGNVSMALSYGDNNRVRERLMEAERACLRAKDLTMQLLTFSRGGEPIKSVASVRDIIIESAEFAMRGSPSVCRFELDEALWPAAVDPGQISQVIQNLIMNADQSMPGGGIISVKAGNVMHGPGEDDDEELANVTPGPYCRISVSDNGMGIPEGHLKKIFDPFFTTKQRGSGLGLSVSYSIIKNHGGGIRVKSRLGEGAEFIICLPASPGLSPSQRPGPEPVRKGKGRILVMDDERSIIDLLEIMLPELGYEPVFTEDGEGALVAYKEAMENGAPFDAVIMDLTIPGGTGGKEAVARLLKMDPGAVAIVSSGYSTDPVMAGYRDFGFKAMIAKPYDPEQVGKVLGEVLGAKASG